MKFLMLLIKSNIWHFNLFQPWWRHSVIVILLRLLSHFQRSFFLTREAWHNNPLLLSTFCRWIAYFDRSPVSNNATLVTCDFRRNCRSLEWKPQKSGPLQFSCPRRRHLILLHSSRSRFSQKWGWYCSHPAAKLFSLSLLPPIRDASPRSHKNPPTIPVFSPISFSTRNLVPSTPVVLREPQIPCGGILVSRCLDASPQFRRLLPAPWNGTTPFRAPRLVAGWSWRVWRRRTRWMRFQRLIFPFGPISSPLGFWSSLCFNLCFVFFWRSSCSYWLWWLCGSVDLKTLVEQNKQSFIPPSSRMTNYVVLRFGDLKPDPSVSFLSSHLQHN